MRNTSMKTLALSLALVCAAPIYAAEKDDKKDDKKVDISDLENKYWAPKDTDFSVVQNRTYPKDHKFFLAPQYGFVVNDQYNEGSAVGLTGNYFLSERYGLQVSGFKTSLKLNKAMRDLVNLSTGVQPDHGQLESYMGIGFNWVPFYAKMSVLGQRIIYFDMAITPTLGMTQYDQVIESGNRSKSSLTYGLDVSQYFLFSKWVALRADLKNQWHQEEVAKYHGNGASTFTGDKVSNKLTHDTLFMMGVMFFW